MDKVSRLQEIFSAVTKDENLKLLQEANFVGGTGDLNSPLMLVGEAPGKVENARRRPFAGPAGVELKKLLIDVKLDHYHPYLTNIVKYWPHDTERKTRTPTNVEIHLSREYLLQEIEVICPKIVALCGLSATKAIYPETKSIKALNGKLLDGMFVPVLHPAALLWNAENTSLVVTGFEAIRRHLRNKERNS